MSGAKYHLLPLAIETLLSILQHLGDGCGLVLGLLQNADQLRMEAGIRFDSCTRSLFLIGVPFMIMKKDKTDDGIQILVAVANK